MTKLIALTATILLAAGQCQAPAKKPTTCHEGDSCWNCHVMGNKRCGPSDRKNL